MNNRTYEIFAKYIGKNSGIKIKFVEGACPCANPITKEVTLPTYVDEDSIFPALAAASHEACHCRYTTFPIDKVVDDEYEKFILNAVEDIRIDNKAFGILPNIRSFYRDLFEDIAKKRPDKATREKLPFEARVMCEAICQQENMEDYATNDHEVRQFIVDYDINSKVYECRSALDSDKLDIAKQKVKEIADCFDTELKKDKTNQKLINGKGNANGLAAASAKIGKDPNKGWGGGKGQGSAYSEIGSLATEEQTKRQFEELLKVREEINCRTESGNLNLDNLTSFLTGDVDDLFVEQEVIRPKKSKIIIVLDASGSMQTTLLDGKKNWEVVGKTAKSIADVIDSVNEAEGLCVDYEVAAFTSVYLKLNKDDWEADYQNHLGGGTDIYNAFKQAQTDLMSDKEIEGNKVMVFITDGEVSDTEIDNVKTEILRTNSEIRTLIIGVGANPQSSFCQKVVGDKNILEEEIANSVLMEAISEALE